MSVSVRTVLLAALLAWPASAPPAQTPPPSLFGYGAQRPLPDGDTWDAPPGRDDFGLRQAGTVRTVCVRLCDGYYFPMSFGVPRSILARDADACSTSCGVETRLFYQPTPGGDADSLIDLSGMAYTSLPNAYRYRRALVAGCSCRPQPRF
jgi:hypothetical protein